MTRETKKQQTEKAIISLVLEFSYTMDQIKKENDKDQEMLDYNARWLEKHGISYTDFCRKQTKKAIDRLSDLGYTGLAETFDYI